MWRRRPVERIEPGPGQESVWDYPRPPRLERTDAYVRVEHAGALVVETTKAYRVLETSQAPAFYLPMDDVLPHRLRPAAGRSRCEWKGEATYVDVVIDGVVAAEAGWTYPDPTPPYAALRDHVAFYPQRVDACWVEGELVEPNAGGFYGGWVTSKVVGPFKGAPGTEGW